MWNIHVINKSPMRPFILSVILLYRASHTFSNYNHFERFIHETNIKLPSILCFNLTAEPKRRLPLHDAPSPFISLKSIDRF